MALPDDAFPPRFTIGRVIALAVRGYRHHVVAVTAICLAGGIAGASALYALLTNLVQIDGQWRVPILELVLVGPATLVAMPVIVLLLAFHAGRKTSFRDVLKLCAARCLVFVPAVLLFDVINAVPGFLDTPSSPVLSTIALIGYLAQQVAFTAFDCIYMPVLMAEPVGPLAALRRTVSLASVHWLRMLLIAVIILLCAWAVVTGTTYAVQFVIYAASHWIMIENYSVDYITILLPVAQGVALGLRLAVVIALGTAAYHLLRQVKEGRPIHDVARVFE
jgi:hypothetical protein